VAAKPETNMSTQSQAVAIKAPRAGTKQAKLVGLLSRKNGVTLETASKALGWLPHTTSATMTSLRKRGYVILCNKRENKASLYAISTGKTP